MNEYELEDLTTERVHDTTISAEEVRRSAQGVGDRTLVFGYTLDRDTVHAYLRDGEIHVVHYSHDRRLLHHVHGEEVAAADLVPSKRAYPNTTDYFTAVLLKQKGFPLSITTSPSVSDVGPNGYVGALVEELA